MGEAQPIKPSYKQLQQEKEQLQLRLRDLQEAHQHRENAQDYLLTWLNKQGGELRSKLEAHVSTEDDIHTQELDLITRCAHQFQYDAALMHAFKTAGRKLSWTRAMFYDPIERLNSARIDNTHPSLGTCLYGKCIQEQKNMSVIDLEATATHAATLFCDPGLIVVEGTRDLQEETRTLLSESSSMLRASTLLSRARLLYRTILQSHLKYVDSLTSIDKLCIKLRDTHPRFKHSWDNMLPAIDALATAGVDMFPLLGLGELPIDHYREAIAQLQNYEKAHNINLSWFLSLPPDIVVFCAPQ
ncbi:hypothetical protein HY492_01890 [Candidatus Woesearchaeota archaeon]|nr:hypothetical protein [Candidatus Woesearchaeota archaeon]